MHRPGLHPTSLGHAGLRGGGGGGGGGGVTGIALEDDVPPQAFLPIWHQLDLPVSLPH